MPQIAVLPPDTPASDDDIKPAGWWHGADGPARVVCDLCPRGCTLLEGKRGFCFVRQNLHGRMVTTTYGRSTGFCIDPIEKKPLNHFYPGSAVLSFGTAGCNLGCKFCQNWEVSKSREVDALGERADPETVARAAVALHCRSVAFTYNDPVVWAEYAIDCAKACRAAGVKTVAVTAGYITPQARKTFFEAMDAANVDLKGFTEDFYREATNSRLSPVLDTLQWLARESNVWLEVTNLIIPGKNDSEETIQRMCGWFAETLGVEVPLHFSAFHPDFQMRDISPTPPSTLARAHEIAVAAGLRYVYTGNIIDRARQSTYCPGCRQVLIGRDGYRLTAYSLRGNRCGTCGWTVGGQFAAAPGDWGPRRLPVRIAEHRQFHLTLDQQRRIFAAAGRRVFAEVLGGAAPSVSASGGTHPSSPPEGDAASAALSLKTLLGSLPRMEVAGAFITLKRAGVLRGCCGSLGDALSLYDAIDRAAVAVAKHDPRFPCISPAELPHLEMHVTLLHQMQTVAAKGADRRNAVIVGLHGLKIARGDRRGLLLPVVAIEHGLDAERFLELVCQKAGLPADSWQRDDVVLTTFQGHAIKGPLAVLLDEYCRGADVPPAEPAAETAAPQSLPGGAIRLPAVAGMFYPAEAEQIHRMSDGWFASASSPETWAAALVPHAGWIYSGRLAAEVFGRVKFPRRVIVLAPKHGREGANWAIAPHAVWQLPGACLHSDPELARSLAQSIDGLQLDAAAHANEHAIEVQLPLIARLAPHVQLIGITIHDGEPDDLRRFAAQMAAALAALSERPLLVISSDMNHYAPDGETRRLDRLALNALRSLDPDRFLRVVRDNRISMCGVLPAFIVLNVLHCLNSLSRCCEVGYTTSAAVSGDTTRSVGYAGMLFR